MEFFSSRSSRILCAFFALFVITGDLVADAVHDATGACVTEAQNGGHDSCPACSGCAIHTATALMDAAAIIIVADDGAGAPLPQENDKRVIGLAAAIDHPPQLA
jgi:hypothetical protein